MNVLSSKPASDIFFCETLSVNASLKILELYDITITDKDLAHLSNVINTNKTLKELHLINCDITDKGIRYVFKGLTKNQTLTVLDISHNLEITSVSSVSHTSQLKTEQQACRKGMEYFSLFVVSSESATCHNGHS